MNNNSKSIRKGIGKQVARLTVCLFSLSLAFSTPYSFAQPGSQQEENLAGRIIVVSGDVFARDSSGDDRELQRRSAVFEGDTIITAAAATTQIRMVDDAIIALKESTAFSIVAYQYEENPVADISSIELIEGGFRTITGAIGRQNREAYEASIANFATIGIRGTDYEVVITPVGEVITGVYDGGTRVSNDAGELDLGFGAQYDFAIVPDPDTPPQGLTLQPEGIGSIPLAALDQDDDEDDDGGDDDNGNTANDGNQDDGDGNDDNDDGADGGDADADNAAVPNVPAATNNDDSGDDDSDNSLNLAPPAAAVVADTPAADTANSAVNEERETSQSALSVNPNETTGDGSVACSNATTSCLQANGDDPTDNGNGNGNGNSDNDNAGGNSDNDNNAGGNSDNDNNAGGNSDNDNNAGGNSDNDNNAGGNSDNYNAGGNSDNDNNAGGNSDNDNNAGGNSDNASATGDSDNDNAGGNSDNDNNAGGNSDNDNNAGGNSDNDSAGGKPDDPGKPEDKPSAKEELQDFVDTLRSRGLIDDDDDRDKDNNGNGNSDKDKDKDKDNNGNGKDKSSLTAAPAPSVERSTIAWDRWDEPLDQNWVAVAQVDDDLVRISTSNYFALVNPTAVANMQGSHSYATGIASSFIGSGNAGEISSLTAGMDVNFDTGAISNGSLQVQVADQAWSVDFSGAVMNGAVDLNALGGQLIDNTGIISNSIEANLGGVFTGNSAEAFVGGFDLLDSVNTLNSVNGLYSIER